MSKIVGVVCSRMASSRLNGKAMLEIEGVPMARRVVDRVAAAQGVAETILATTTDKEDDVLFDMCEEQGINVYRGSPSNVLERVLRAADSLGADAVLRVTGDCPLVDVGVLGMLCEGYHEAPVEYASNLLPRSYPEGLDAEIISRRQLLNALLRRDSISQEHVTTSIRRLAELGKISSRGLQYESVLVPWVEDKLGDIPRIHLSVDTQEDLDNVRNIAMRWVGANHPYVDEVLCYIAHQPDLLKSLTR